MIDRQALRAGAARVGAALDQSMLERLDIYAARLVEWNEKINLTAITDPEGIVRKHFIDSLTLAPLLPAGKFSLIDVGTGAGFPGMPLAVLRGDMELTLLDSLNKRLVFIEALCAELGITARLIHARAEEAGRKPELRERFDVATARAVAALPTLCEYCLPFVRTGGRFLAMKGPDGDREAETARRAASLLGARPGEIRSFLLEGGGETSERRLIVFDKIGPTPPAYPRASGKIAKQPL